MLLLLLFAACSAFPALADAAEAAAVNTREARVYFDVSLGEPEKLVLRLGLIEKTREDLIAAGLTPRIVVGIRGKAAGMRLEQCGLAADMQGIARTDFLPQLEVVGNGYVAMITYQGQGYAYVPMD
jgi:hypothetical protein